MLQLVGVHKQFGTTPVLRGVDLEVHRGRVTFVVGRSGAGKSVLSRCCVGLLRIDSGEVHVEGERIDGWPERRLLELRRRVPYVVQGSALLDGLDLRDNVALPLSRGLRLTGAQARQRAEEALTAVGLLELAHRLPPEVGPGVRKRAAMARALALQPVAVLYDEPTTGLDGAASQRVNEVIRVAAERGVAALVVSHDLASLRQIAHRVVLLDEGLIGFNGTVQAFFEQRDKGAALRRFFHQDERSIER